MTTTALATTDFGALAPIEGERRRLFAETICVGAKPVEVEMAIEICKQLQLDPFKRQIYFVKMQGRMQTVIGIDGHRAIAERSGLYEGQGPVQWCGEDGVWKDVWLGKGAPAAAKVTIYRKGFREPLVTVARTRSYSRGGNLWTQMPDVMIAKCCEALGHRKAFPEVFGGVFAPEEITEVEDGQIVGPAQPPPPGVHKMPAKKPEPGVEDAEVVDEPDDLQTRQEFISSFVSAGSLVHLNTMTPAPEDVAHLSEEDKELVRKAFRAARDSFKPAKAAATPPPPGDHQATGTNTQPDEATDHGASAPSGEPPPLPPEARGREAGF
jgi:phage recombination protein Bet